MAVQRAGNEGCGTEMRAKVVEAEAEVQRHTDTLRKGKWV